MRTCGGCKRETAKADYKAGRCVVCRVADEVRLEEALYRAVSEGRIRKTREYRNV